MYKAMEQLFCCFTMTRVKPFEIAMVVSVVVESNAMRWGLDDASKGFKIKVPVINTKRKHLSKNYLNILMVLKNLKSLKITFFSHIIKQK